MARGVLSIKKAGERTPPNFKGHSPRKSPQDFDKNLEFQIMKIN